MIDNLTIMRVKEAANIVDVIGEFYSLRRDGTSGYTCLCPFHADKHIGSFKISPRLNLYTCYSCGEHGGPVDFLMEHEKLSFPDAIRWLGKKYGIEVEGAEEFQVKPSKPRVQAQAAKLEMLTLPYEMVKHTSDTTENTLCKWLRGLPWYKEQKERIDVMLKNYMIGHSKKGGHTVFWQVDQQGQVRTGKMMLYKPDGHRDKVTRGNFDWIHSRLIRAGKVDDNRVERKLTLFGMHLLDFCPNATVNIVESEKTALICAIAYGDMQNHIWMACGGLQMLTREKLEPIIKRKRYIVIYPDKDGVEAWKQQAKMIGYDRLKVNSDVIDRYWMPEDGERADIADILVRMLRTQVRSGGPKSIYDVMMENEAFRELVNRFELQLVKDYNEKRTL